MNVKLSVSTWDVLQELGFTPDQGVLSHEVAGLSFDFGDFKLEASWLLNRRFVPIVLLSGVLATERTISAIECEMPRELESPEQGKAFVTWCLDNSISGSFEPRIAPEWLAEGRLHFDLLPWKRQAATYATRPHCSIRRDWARIALKTLTEHLTEAEEDEAVILSFDGEVLTVRCAGKVIAMPADGDAWTNQYSIEAKALNSLPKRLIGDPIEVSFWESALTIGNRRYDGAKPTTA